MNDYIAFSMILIIPLIFVIALIFEDKIEAFLKRREKKVTLLWLDDNRNPFENDWLVFSPVPHTKVVWVKSYAEFTDWITKNGLPDGICFDHDLAIEHTIYYFDNGGHASPPDPLNIPFTEKTGYDCAKWLVDYCIDNKKKLPKWNVQSANPCGKDNINGLLSSFRKYQDKK